MIDTFNLIIRFNGKLKILLILLLTIFLSISEAVGFAVLSPLFSLLVNFQNEFLLNTNNFFIKNISNYFNISDKFIFLKTYILFILIYYFIKFFLTVISIVINANFIYNFRNKVQKEILSKFVHKPYEFHLNKNSTELVRFASDEITNYFNQVITPLVLLSAEIFIIISLLIFAFFYSPIFFIFFFIFAIFCLIILNLIKFTLNKIGKRRLTNDLLRHQILQQIFFGIKDIIIFSKERELIEENINYTKQISKSDKKYLIFESLPRHIIELLTILIFCIIFYIFFKNSNINFVSMIPKITIYALIFFRILPSFTRIARGITAMSYARDVEKNILKYLNETKDEKKEIFKYKFNKNIVINYLDYKYEGSENVIKYDKEIEIVKGSFNCIVGESGVGKTTFFDLITGLLKPNSSKIFIDEKKVSNFPLVLDLNLGIVHQNFFLFNDTLLKNITFLEKGQVDLNLINKILKIVLLENFVKELPKGLNSNIGEIGTKISGGQRQRIAIARALYQKPDFILFDEATSALDMETETKLLDNLKTEYKNKKTFIMISHKVTNKKIFDNIIEI